MSIKITCTACKKDFHDDGTFQSLADTEGYMVYCPCCGTYLVSTDGTQAGLIPVDQLEKAAKKAKQEEPAERWI